MTIVVYGDFTCPYSYLASRRTDVLTEAGTLVEWRAVEHRPGLPVAGRTLDPPARAALEDEIAEIRGLLIEGEDLPLAVPHLQPRTEAAAAGLAEAAGVGMEDEVRRLLFSAYWLHGTNIGDPEALRGLLVGPILRGHGGADPLHESGYAVSVSGGPITTAAYRRIQGWRRGWAQSGSTTTPTVVADAAVIVGVDGLRYLGERVRHVGGLPTQRRRDRAEPADSVSPSVRPEPQWVSTVGGPWSRSYLIG